MTAIGEGDGSSVHLSLLDRRTLGLGKAVASEVYGHSVDTRIRRTFAVDHLKKEERGSLEIEFIEKFKFEIKSSKEILKKKSLIVYLCIRKKYFDVQLYVQRIL